jgi:hypothetical protein
LASRHPLADYSSDLVVRRAARLIYARALRNGQHRFRSFKRIFMPDTQRAEAAQTLFEPAPTREEITDALKLENERRAVLVKNMFRLRALRLSRANRSIQEA